MEPPAAGFFAVLRSGSWLALIQGGGHFLYINTRNQHYVDYVYLCTSLFKTTQARREITFIACLGCLDK